MCGGNLQVAEGQSYGTCDSCGTTMTIPKTVDERILNLFNRANDYRLNNEFDKALATYESILSEDNTNAEAHWGCVISKYGIEYVEDPVTHKRIPTCHRVQSTSILADLEYKKALEYADDSSKELYTKEATEISEIQKRILAIANQEDAYDIFICYKETDEYGKRTMDSALAQDIYFQLKDEGYKVFFSRITLEDKLGQEYEPYIFAALNSAKVMLVVGTKPEYYNAVWVKNEWSRFLKLMKNDRSKMLIPCYRDMDAYELPEEFAHLQAQDMSKIGFIQDIVRGIKKVANGNKPKEVAKETIVSSQNSSNISALLKRGNMALEDEEWEKADEFFEQVLNFNAELPEAYLGKLLAEFKCHNPKGLSELTVLFTQSKNYEKAVRFGKDTLVSELNDYEQSVKDNLSQIIYESAIKIMGYAETEEEFEEAIHKLNSINAYKDSIDKIEDCKKSIQKLQNEAVERRKAKLKKEEEIAERVKKNRIIATAIIVLTVILNFIVGEPVFMTFGIIGSIVFFVRANKIKNGNENGWKNNQFNYNSLNNRRKFK